MAENFLNVRGWGATLTIKSASGREVKGKEALRVGKKKGFHFIRLCWPVSGGLIENRKRERKRYGGEKKQRKRECSCVL